MRKLCIAVLLLSLFSCGSRDQGEQAARVARESYNYLLKGKTEAFVDATYREHPIPQSYRDQLILAAEMFLEQQDSLHQGISKISVIKGELLPDSIHANAYLLFHYGNGNAEQVMVPMVKNDGKWYLK